MVLKKEIMMNFCFVSSADARYYPLLMELIHSIRHHYPHTPIGIIDAGLSAEQLAKLSNMPHIQISNPDWPCPIPAKKIAGKTFLKACVSRPFIPILFPNFESYVWLDADTWLQTPEAVDLLLQGAKKRGLAIVPQTDRAYPKSMRLGWLGAMPWRPRSFYYSNAKKAFNGKTARALFPHATLNAGVFAIHGNAPHWARWQELIVMALKRGKVFTAEQLSLGMMVYLEKFDAEFLPAWCNWLCETLPVYNPRQQQFVEPYLPHHSISVVHLSGMDEMRVDRAVKIALKTTEDTDLNLSLRCPLFNGEKA
jgi:hypothetical protein